VLPLVGLPLLGLLALVAPARGGDDDVEIRPYDGVVWNTVPKMWVQFLVRDAQTGRPVAGATIRRHLELDMGDDATWAPARGEWRTDAYGVFTLDCDTTEDGDATSHWSVEAPGYAVTETYGAAGSWEILELKPGLDRHGLLLDAGGRPARGVLVEWKVGCAHAPALRVARTDANGRYVFRGIERSGDVCYDGPGILADYADDADLGPLDQPPPVRLAGPALTLRGRLVNAPSGVLDLAVVRGMTSSRGPLARVARDGTFVLEGVGANDQLWLDAKGKESYAVLDLTDFRHGGPIVWDLAPAAVPLVTLRVLERYPAGKPDDFESPLELAFDAVTDGRRTCVAMSTDADVLDATVALAPGAYDVAVPGSGRWSDPFARFRTPPQRIVVAAPPAAPPEVSVTLVEQPRLIVEFAPRPSDDLTRLVLDLPGLQRSFVPADEVSLPVFLPADVEATVRVVGHLRAARVGPPEGGVRRVVVDPRPTATLRVRHLDLGAGDTIELAGQQAPELDEDEGILTFPWTRPGGPVRLRIAFEAGGVVETTIVVPDGPGAVLDVDVATLPRLPAGRIDLRGLPAGGAWSHVATFDDQGRHVVVGIGPKDTFVEHPAFTPGRWLKVVGDGVGDFHRRLSGSSPFVVAVGTATLRLRFPAAGGIAPTPEVDVVGVGAGYACEPEGGWDGPDDGLVPRGDVLVNVPHLEAGEHTVLVGVDRGYGSVALRVRLTDGQTREVTVNLPRR